MSLSVVDYGGQNQEGGKVVRNHLRKQLAVAVRSVQWSYAIFWSSSTTLEGVLEWGDGYYNGNIKKRKKGQAMELKSYKFGLQRSEQLRQLYLSMLEGESTDQNKTVFSAEDLSDEEWYYLVCMSYVFNPGQGLPGRTLANGDTMWLCNAQCAETKLFTRSLLARSASVQTVVCFPYLGGVLELGVTQLVAEDHSLLQHIKACLLDFSKPDCYGIYSSADNQNGDDDDDNNRMAISHKEEENFMLENFSNSFQELQEGNHTRLGSMDLGSDEDLRYRGTVSTVLTHASRAKKNSNLDCSDSSSNFTNWKKRGMANLQPPQATQNVLRKILHNVPSLHCAYKYNSSRKENSWLNQREKGFSLPDKRREKEKFQVLRSKVPSDNEIDKASILNDTIKYVKELEARVEELESCMGSVEFEERPKKNNHSEIIEETSGNYNQKNFDTNKNQWLNKRKASDIKGDTEQEISIRESEGFDTASDVKVKVKEQEVLIEIRCPYREYIVADIMDAISNLHMDAYSVRSSTLDGFLTLYLKAKFRQAAVAPARMIKRELCKITSE